MSKRRKKSRKALEELTDQDILGSISGKGLSFKELASKLGIQSRRDMEYLHTRIMDLKTDRKLGVSNKGRLRTKTEKRGHYTVGIIELTRSGAGYVLVEGEDKDIYVHRSNVSNALDGDKVKISIQRTRGGRGRVEGEVVEIISRAKKSYTCTLQLNEKFAFGIADDQRMSKDLFIPPKNLNGAKDGEKVLVEITEYGPDFKNPVAKVTRRLGMPGENETEMLSILLDKDLQVEFPPSVIKELDSIEEDITPEEIGRRLDMRQILTITIDPFDAKDFDDAISFQSLENGFFEVGVHIADVSYYLQPGTRLDDEAKERATSVYMADRVVPMLPERLSNYLCSLRPNEDKLAFSGIFVITPRARVVESWFGRTIINSDQRFTYEEAQEIIEKGSGPHADTILTLNKLARQFRDKRFRKGSLSFDREEIKFRLDQEGKPLEVLVKKSQEAHQLIEEFMLLCNRLVTERYRQLAKKQSLPFVYRVHDTPNDEKLESLAAIANRFGHSFNPESSTNLARDLNALLAASKGKPEENLISTLALRSMSKAKYTTNNIGHYGLSFESYTHFTSPIRRYPDVLAHRLLAAVLSNSKAPSIYPQEELEALCLQSSEREVKAEEAERESIKLKQVEYMQQFLGDEFDGIISGVTERILFVQLSNKCEGGVRVEDIIDDNYFYDEDNFRLVGYHKRRILQLGASVRVRVIGTDYGRRTIELDFIS